ncbi:MAG TPA: 30S ribosomal protein S12 methylthiotransferase RimO [Edaphobacter sp.]|uniref:30S ribosomal protein S12 methylthiotransferase RimO n=1 Tax=Edaphobacter sp. TaxID=1934404 RepID=UPI002CA8F0F1|nr:30S ribosomal protein S12 methylthiotransferase RimO [Edaphobacter sp.]HUZ93659.1 30S ribosomal protein S12 methylthiotransferase RimO [Edaphobacter sp.]
MTPPAILEELTQSAPAKPRPKIGFVSLGCPKNLVDSEVMMGMLHQAGGELTSQAEDAEILVVNTCSFIDSAKQESVNTILEMVQHKQANGGRAQRLIVAGCLVERYRDEIQKNIPEVDAVVGTGELEAILAAAGLTPTGHANNSPFQILTQAQIDRAPSAVHQHSRPESDGAQLQIEQATKLGVPHLDSEMWARSATPSRPEGDLREQQGRFSRTAWDGATAALPEYLYSDTTPRILTTPRASAYIKIAEGCDHPCGFCIIPQLRGKFRSRRMSSIITEAENLIAQGVREITLIGQDTTCYGEDLGIKDGLAQLLEALAALPGLRWLRFLYAYPNKVTTRLLETIARHDNIAKYLDVPLQHASPSVLKRMKRGGTPEVFLKLIEKARSIVPGIVLRTSFIVGFPGETEEDYKQLEAFITAAQIDWLGVFTYSDEEGAAAFELASELKVPKRTIEARRRKLMKLQQKISAKSKSKWIGREIDLLVEGPSEETDLLWEGRTPLHAPEIDGKVFINDFGPHEALVPGTFYRAEITESHDYDLVARILE